MKYVLLAMLLSGLAAGPACAQSKAALEQYQWKNRLMLVFAPSDQDGVYQKLKEQLQTSTRELVDRDLLVLHLFAEKNGWVDGTVISEDSVRSLYREYDIRDVSLTVVLIGKDGGEKLRQVDEFDLQAIFDRIDAMPMRQREKRKRDET